MGLVVEKKVCLSHGGSIVIPEETHLGVQHENVSNTSSNVKEELSCERPRNKTVSKLKFFSHYLGKIPFSCLGHLNGSELST